MAKKNSIFVFVLIIMLSFFLVQNIVISKEQQTIFNRAGQEYAKHNYREALDLYRELLSRQKDPEQRKLVGLQILKTLKALKSYDEFTEETEKYLALYPETIWKARAAHLAAVFYQEMPHEGYKYNGKISRNSEYREGEYIYLYEQDWQKAEDYFQQAKEIYSKLKENKENNEEHLKLNFDFATFLQTKGTPLPIDIKISPEGTFQNKWDVNSKIVFLYDQVLTLNQLVKNPEYSAEAIFRKAVLIFRSNGFNFDYGKKDNPFRDNPEELLAKVIKEYPKTKVAPEALYTLGQVSQFRQDFNRALEIFNSFLQKYPDHKFSSNAKAGIQEITREELFVSGNGVQPSEKTPDISVSTRNLQDFRLKIYQADSQKIFLSENKPAEVFFSDLYQLIGNNFSEAKRHYREKIWEKSIVTGDQGKHLSTTNKLSLPLLKPGTYLFEFTGKNVSVLRFLMISDLVIVQDTDADQEFIYVLEAKSGRPVEKASVIIKEHFYDNNNQVLVKKLRTDKDGKLIYEKKRKNNSNSVEVFARKGEQVIFSNLHYYYHDYYGQNDSLKIYSYTDRPVYRPGQKVYLKQIIRSRQNGDYQVIPGQKILLTISDPKGNKVLEKNLQTNKFGTVETEFSLTEDAALGSYQINSVLSGEQYRYPENSAGSYFRVEEYKRPEYTVTFSKPQKQIQAGEKVELEMSADYYFGAPVAGAKVKYKISKKPYYQYYYPYRHYEWSYWRRPLPNEDSSGQLIYEGQAETDPQGKIKIEFKTEKSEQDYQYDVVAEVTDKSRRVISGQTTVKVTDKAFNAFISIDRGFYTPGENIGVEINLRNPDEQPVQSEGTLAFFALSYSGKNKEKEELKPVFSEKVKTDAQGRFSRKLKAPAEGYFRIVFTASDSFGKKVESSQEFWITGENFSGRHFQFKNVEILTDQETYREGEVARIMVNTNYPDSYVIFSSETDQKIIDNKLLFIPDKVKVLSLKIGEQHLPNFNLKAALVRENQLFLANKELFVPPTKKFLKLTVLPDQKSYLPGAEGKVKVKVTDQLNRPVQTEVSLTGIDRSLYYIQGDLAGDIRQFFYGQRRYFQNRITTSFSVNNYQISEERFKEKRYERIPSIFENYQFFGDTSDRRVRSGMVNAPAAVAEKQSAELNSAKKDASGAERKEISGGKSPEIRSNFAETAFWAPTLLTDKNGEAELKFRMPDALTTWNISAKAADSDTRVGSETAEIITRKDLIVRLQTPRFFVEKDQLLISAVVNNYLQEEKKVDVTLDSGSLLITKGLLRTSVKVPANGEKRVDWLVEVKKAGTAKIIVKAVTTGDSDAMSLNFPVLTHGTEKLIAQNQSLGEQDKKGEIILNLPEERRKGETKLTLTFNASVLSTLTEALPYLATYPYGCIEQTTSRFIPTVLVAKTLKESGFVLSDIQAKGKYDRFNHNPVFSEKEIEKMVNTGIKRISGFQNQDGGWGWWNGSSSDVYMSAYAFHGLLLAKESGFSISDSVYQPALNFLQESFSRKNISDYNRLYLAYVLSLVKKVKTEQLEDLFQNRDQLNNYGKALLSLSFGNIGEQEKAKLILQNLKSFVRINKNNGTASWDNDQQWWYWYGDRIETNAFILKAFVQNNPKDEIVPLLAKWILNNRKGNYWYSTKDTANAIYALVSYAKEKKELDPNFTFTVSYNGREIKKIKVDKENMLSFENNLVLNEADLGAGKGKISINKEGKGTLYFASALEYYSLEENIKGSGNEIQVQREYLRIIEEKDESGKIVTKKELINPFETIKSGELIEVRLVIKADNNYEYLIFEDYKPAGFETLDLQSGYQYQNGIYLNRELRDEKVVFFIDHLKQGTQVLTYRLRAEIPGDFHALPHKAYAMYAPEVKSISDEMRIKISD